MYNFRNFSNDLNWFSDFLFTRVKWNEIISNFKDTKIKSFLIILALIILIYYFLKIIYFFLKIILRILLFLVSILLLIKLLDSAQILSKFKLNTEDQKDKSETEVENQEKGEKSEDSSPENFGTED